jgi:hypothetical protein
MWLPLIGHATQSTEKRARIGPLSIGMARRHSELKGRLIGSPV